MSSFFLISSSQLKTTDIQHMRIIRKPQKPLSVITSMIFVLLVCIEMFCVPFSCDFF